MLRLIGCVLLLCTSTTLGFGAANSLKERVNELNGLINSFKTIELELLERRTPLQELLGKAENSTDGKVRRFYTLCVSGLKSGESETFSEIWKFAMDVSELHLHQRENVILQSVGGILGRYDAKSQCSALEAAREELISAHSEAKELSARMGRVYRTLGITIGSVLLIVLI